MFELLLLAVGMIAVMAALLGLVIGLAARVFAVEGDPRVEAVAELLPGANCGGCGFAGCADLAKALVAGAASPAACPVCSSLARGKIAGLLGLAGGAVVRRVALVRCGGDYDKAKFKAKYNGVSDCKSAALVASGAKGCGHGCLGLGSCARACPFGAIEVANGLAVVHPRLCVGCGKCVEACPKKLIKLVPESAKVHVLCNSPEKGAAKRKVCEAACVGCRKCAKVAGEGQVRVNGFLAEVNYVDPPHPGLVDAVGCRTVRQALTGREEEAA